MPRETDYEVGYKKPPKETRFKKGQSGNPRGRPSATENLRMLLGKVLDETITLTENGRHRKISLYKLWSNSSFVAVHRVTTGRPGTSSNLCRSSSKKRSRRKHSKLNPRPG